MKTPSSPAFNALGLAPSSVERPTTPKGAAVAVATGLAAAAGVSPAENFAVELTPYWTFPHPDVTAEELLNEGAEAIYRNASLSMAVVRGASSGTSTITAGGTTVPDTRASVGLRTTLLPGRPSDAALACHKHLRARLDATVARMSTTRVEFLKEWEAKNPQPTVQTPGEPKDTDFADTDAGRAAFDAAIKKWREELKKTEEFNQSRSELVQWRAQRRVALATYMEAHPPAAAAEDPLQQTCMDRIHDRRGFLMDVATAGTLTVPAGNLHLVSSAGRYGMHGWLTGGWVTGTYLLGAAAVPNSWSLLGSAHLEREVAEPGSVATTKLDFGGRGIWAWGRFGLWLEGGYRRQWVASMHENLYKATVGFDVRVTGSTWFNVVFGKDFGINSDDKPLLTLANLQWAFGPERKLLPDTAVSQ